MILQFGAAVLLIWLMNWMWIFYEIIRHTPNWTNKEVDSDEIVQNFMTNSTFEKIEMIQKVGKMNPALGMIGASLLLIAMII